MSKAVKSKIVLSDDDKRLALVHRDTISKHRYWVSGYEAGSGKTVPNHMELVAVQRFLEELARP